MKKMTPILFILMAISLPAFGQKKTELLMGTASMGGAYYPVGQGISNLVTKYSGNYSMVPIVTGGAPENPRLIISGDIDIALTNANYAYYAYMGMPPYEKKLDIACIASLYSSVCHIATLENSPINNISDLKGKRIAVGPAGGATIDVFRILLEEYGMSMKDVIPSYLAYGDGFSAMSDGNVDAALAVSGYPAAAVMQTVATKKIKFIEINPLIMESVKKKYPYYTDITVPKDVYKTEKDAIMVGMQNVLIVKRSLSEDAAYKVVKALFDNLSEFAAVNANAKQIDIKKAPQTPIPLHVGAEKFFSGK